MNEAEQLAALEQRLLAKEQAIAQLEAMPDVGASSLIESAKQFAFDVPVGVARAGAGLADILSYPVVKGLEYAGAPVETFGLSKLLTEAAGPETPTQEVVSFLTPSPLSKAKLLSQAGTGLASYLGMKGAETIAPESEYAGLVGALAGPAAVSGMSKIAGAVAPKLEEAGLGLQRRAFGITKADYKNAKNAVIETVSGDFSTQLKESVNDLIKNKTLGTSLDPGAMYAELQGAKSATEDAIQTTLKAAEAKIGPVPPPTFDKTLDYISKNIAADQVDKYVNNVIEFQDALRREGQGSLTYLNQQKKIIGENWKNSPQSDPGFWRTIYGDVKSHIEKYAPQVKDLNKEKQKLIIAEPIVSRNFKASGADYDIGAIQKLLNTTGGAGLAGGALLGAATGSIGGGMASALALRALSTPTGQNITGRGLRGTASLAEALGGAGLDVGGVLQRGGVASGAASMAEQKAEEILSTPEPDTLEDIQAQREQLKAALQSLTSTPEPAPQPEAVKIGKQSVSIPTGEKYTEPRLVKAVMQAESAFNPKAVSPKGAGGLMQIMPETAKDLGLTDRFDPDKNVEAGSRYLKQLENAFEGDRKLALAAYNWGIGKVQRKLKEIEKQGEEPTFANLYEHLPGETKTYIRRVMLNYNLLEA